MLIKKSVILSVILCLISEKGLGTKDIPDVIEWNFARYWHHIFYKFGFTKKQLHEYTAPSAKLLDRSVAIPNYGKNKY